MGSGGLGEGAAVNIKTSATHCAFATRGGWGPIIAFYRFAAPYRSRIHDATVSSATGLIVCSML